MLVPPLMSNSSVCGLANCLGQFFAIANRKSVEFATVDEMPGATNAVENSPVCAPTGCVRAPRALTTAASQTPAVPVAVNASSDVIDAESSRS